NCASCGFFDEIAETGSFLCLRADGHAAFAITDSRTKHRDTRGALHDLLAPACCAVPGVRLLFCLPVEVQVNDFGFDRATWTQRSKPDETPLDREIVLCGFISAGFNLNKMSTRVEWFVRQGFFRLAHAAFLLACFL